MVLDDRVDHLPEDLPVGEERHQILEDDARTGKVGYVQHPAGHQLCDGRAAVAPYPALRMRHTLTS